MAGKIDGGQLVVGNLDAFGIFFLVELGAHFETGGGSGCGDGTTITEMDIFCSDSPSPE